MNGAKPILMAHSLFAIILLVVSSLVAQQPVAMNAATEARLTKEIPALMKTDVVPGLSIAVIREGQIVWTESFGVPAN